MLPTSERFTQAIKLHQEGKLAEAEAIYRQLIASRPNHPGALHLLGVIALQKGRQVESLELIQRALSQQPRSPAALCSLGNTLCALGRLEEAVDRYRLACAYQPGFAEAHLNLGNALQGLGRLEEAVWSYQRAVAADPNLAVAHGNLGMVLHDLGRVNEAVTAYQTVVRIWPDSAESHRNLAAALLDSGQLTGAIACCRQALELDVEDSGAWFNLSLALYQSGDSAGALAPIGRYLELATPNPEAWALFGNAFASAQEIPIDANLLPVLMTLLDQPNVSPGPLVRPIFALLRQFPWFLEMMENSESDAFPMFGYTIIKLSQMPLFLRLLAIAPVNDLEVERLLTRIRRKLALSNRNIDLPAEALPFLAALGQQCFVNEYVFEETPEEAVEVACLQAQLAACFASDAVVSPSRVATLAAYRSLFSMAWVDALVSRIWPKEIQALLLQHVFEPREEETIRKCLPMLTPVSVGISTVVQAQYEENPYPRWVRTRRHESTRPIHAVLQSLRPPIDLCGWIAPDPPEVLIAGCGTGEQVIDTASRFIHRRLLAIDLSLASLGYAERKARELGITSIEFAQADILNLGNLGRCFDMIESSGVLHHMADPMAGWRVLVDLLNPGGLMRIALYSEAARQPVVRARVRIAELGWGATPEHIRRFRQVLINEPADPDLDWLRTARDFFSMSECRDLLFHVQEHRFTLPQIEACLSGLSLRFLGFEASPSTWAQFQAFDQDPNASTSLGAWHRFELKHPNTFKGMYQFWCQKE